MSKWTKSIVWIITLGCLSSLVCSAYYFHSNVEWFKQVSTDPNIIEINEASYRIYIFQLQHSLLIRSMGLIGGLAVMFLGLASVFFLWSKDSKMDIEGGGVKANLVSASPGLLALVIGGIVLVSTIASKDKFDPYQPSYVPQGRQQFNQDGDTFQDKTITDTVNCVKK